MIVKERGTHNAEKRMDQSCHKAQPPWKGALRKGVGTCPGGPLTD